MSEAGARRAIGTRPLLLLILIQHLEMLHQFLPFVRLDGYYVTSDITGVPDLFPRIKPILSSLLPWRETPPSVTELKPWVRVVVSAWVLSVVPVLVLNLCLMAFYFPRILATTYDSALVQWDTLREALPAGDLVAVGAAVVQVAILLLPVVGIPLIFIRLGRRVTKFAHSRIADMDLDVGWRASAGAAAAAVIALVAVIAWPNGDFVPLQRGETLDAAELASSFRAADTGRPGLSAERAAALPEPPTFEFERRRASALEPQAAATSAAEPPVAPSASPTPSATPSANPTASPSATPSTSPSASPSPTATAAGSGSTSGGADPSATGDTADVTEPTTSPTPSATPSPTPSPTSSPSPTPTPSPSATAASTPTPTPATRPTTAG